MDNNKSRFRWDMRIPESHERMLVRLMEHFGQNDRTAIGKLALKRLYDEEIGQKGKRKK